MNNSLKRVLSLTLTFIMCLSVGSVGFAYAVWDGASMSEPAYENDAYSISTPSELAWFANEVNTNDNTACAVLKNDIDVTGAKWTQIGSAQDFNGTFDGNGHSVKYTLENITVIYGGFFRTVGKGGTVKNLTVDGTLSVKTAKNYHGGVAGLNNGTIENCKNLVSISASSTKRVTYAGGIAGKNTGLVTGCTNDGQINVTSYAGGIVGENNGGNVTDCVNNGSVTSTNTAGYSGGIIAAVTANASDNKIFVTGCTNNGTVSGGSGDYGYAGGIIAQENVASSYNQYGQNPKLTIEKCTNKGTLSGGNTADVIAKQGVNCTIEIIEKTEPTEEDKAHASSAVKALDESWFRLTPKYGRDTNVIDMVKSALASLGFDDVNVTIKSSADETCIAKDGTITYFYADPDGFRAMWFNSVETTFVIEYNGAEEEYTTNAVVNWDQAKVKDYMNENILSKVTDNEIKGDNESLSAVTENLVLPKVVDNKKFVLVSWTSSDTDAVKIDSSSQSTADTLFDPYIGLVKRGAQDKTVTLTATFTFNRTSYDEADIILTKEFTVTVKALGEDFKNELQKLFDENYTVDKLKVFGTDESINPDAVSDDIQLVIPVKTGIEDYYNYKFSVTSSDESVIKINAYRAFVYRPLPGESEKTVTLTAKMKSVLYDIEVEKTFDITVMPLTQAEIDNEKELMAEVKAHFFDGINDGANVSKTCVVNNLHAFTEVSFAEDGKTLKWVYSYADMTNSGIVPVSIDLTHPSELWDRFKSSDNKIITHENMLVTRGEKTKNVTIKACLSSEKYARYAELYPDNEDFASLSRQNVITKLTVPGKNETSGFCADGERIENNELTLTTAYFASTNTSLSYLDLDGVSSGVKWSVSGNKNASISDDGVLTYASSKKADVTVTAALVDEEGNTVSETEITVKFVRPHFSLIEFLKAFIAYIKNFFNNIFH